MPVAINPISLPRPPIPCDHMSTMNPTQQPARIALIYAAITILALAFSQPACAQDDVFAPDPKDPNPAQAEPGAEPQANPKGASISIGQLLVGADRLSPPRRLGARAHILREAQQVVDAVIIVQTPADAARVIGSWAGLNRLPVLIDDGSLLAAENIARFVRAFKPKTVLYWTPEDTEPWPTDISGSAKKMVETLGLSLKRDGSIGTMGEVVIAMREAGIGPNGVVVVDPDDKAWIAGLALAAGRMQLLTFADGTGRVNGDLTGAEMRQLAGTIQTQLKIIGAKWENIADEVDSVTLVANSALRVNLGIDGKDVKALTDLIGRHRGGIGNRWAWCGAVFGDSQTALYRAMCGLFLPADSAWLFDGYGRGDPWDLYDATSASKFLEQSGYSVEVHDTPANRVRDWRKAVEGGIDADLAFINSRGNMTFFQLGDGKAQAGDIPLLESPIAVHIVHSWSSRAPGTSRSVAGRWLEHGAYLFYGSVDEPFLSAFVQTPKVARRLIAGYPFGAGVRHDTSPPWKLNVLGDPLVTFLPNSRAGNRLDAEVSYDTARPLSDIVSNALKSGDFAEAIRMLTMEGRDTDAARLSAALLKDRPEVVGNDAAFWMILPLYRAGNYGLMVEAYNRIDPERQKTLLLQDALWFAGRNVLARGSDTRMEGLLRRNVREWQEDSDAIELAAHISARAGQREAAAFLEEIAPTVKDKNRRKAINDAVRRFGGNSRP